MKIAVLGVSGFVGRHLAEHLAQKHQVNGWSRQSIQLQAISWYPFSLHQFDVQVLLPFDVVIYAMGAGVQSTDAVTDTEIWEVNLYFPMRLIQELNQLNFQGRLITLGTYFEIGNQAQPAEFNEQQVVLSPLAVSNTYCASKRLLSRFIHALPRKLQHIHLFLPTVFGAGEAAHRLIPVLVASLSNGKQPHLSQGTQVRQYLAITDFCNMIDQLLKLPKWPFVFLNFPAAETLSVRTVAEKVYRFFNQPMPTDLFGSVAARDGAMQYLALNSRLYKTHDLVMPRHLIDDTLSHYAHVQKF